jgi:hypothetical protein
LLRATHPALRVESRVFPAYETRGELVSYTRNACRVPAFSADWRQKAATLAFVDWLTTLVVQLEVGHGAGGGAGKAKIVLMGHSSAFPSQHPSGRRMKADKAAVWAGC